MVVMARKDAAEEIAEVQLLSANSETIKGLLKSIEGSQSRLIISGQVINDAIAPVIENTRRITIIKNNIDNVSTEIDKLSQPLELRGKEMQIIQNQPQKVGLGEYISSLERTRKALRDLKQAKLRTNQQAIQEMSNLLETGSERLEQVFRDQLKEGQQPIEPLQFITKGADFPRLPASRVDQLRRMNEAIVAIEAEMTDDQITLTTPSSKIYAEIRGQYLLYSMQNLAAASLNTLRRQNPGSMYKRGTNGASTYASGLYGIYTAEFANVRDLFMRDECQQVFLLTCQSSLSAFASTLKDLDRYIQDNLMSDCYLAYEVIETVTNNALDLDSHTGASKVKQALTDTCKPLRETAKMSLTTFLNDIRNRVTGISSLPQDSASVSLTEDAMLRLQSLTDYLAPVTSILTSLGDGGWSTPNGTTSSASVPTLRSFDVGPDGSALFAHYASDTIDILMSNLQSRAMTSYKGRPQQGVFLANNVAVIDRMIQSSDLQKYVDPSQSKTESWRKKAVAMYLDAWKETTVYLMDVQYTNRGPRPTSTGPTIDSAAVVKGLSTKDKDAIKDKFKNFNASFDYNVATYRTFKLEPEVRSQLGRGIQGTIQALYNRFWDRYHDIDKGKGKYVKYDKNQLSDLLGSLS